MHPSTCIYFASNGLNCMYVLLYGVLFVVVFIVLYFVDVFYVFLEKQENKKLVMYRSIETSM